MADAAADHADFIPTYSPQVVHLKKEKVKIVQDCYVYIGNEISNLSWQLMESKWHDPYHMRWDLLPSQRLEKYKVYIMNNLYLVKRLKELRGKHLGCLCKSQEYCHGNVLVDLVKTTFKDDFFSVTTKGPLFFSKGQFSPLSNCYQASLKLAKLAGGEGEKKEKIKCFRLSAFQMYVWMRARKSGHKQLAKDTLKCTSISQVHGIHKKIPNVTMTVREQIERMFEILSLKYDQVPNFRKAIQRLARKKRILCEGVESKFWGSGLDLRSVIQHKYDELRECHIKGANYLGWSICMVYTKKEDNYYWMPFMKTLPKSFVEGYKEVCKILAEKSLKEVEEGDTVNDPTENVFVERESTTTSSCCDGRKPPEQCELTSLTHLSRKEISILQCAANEMTDTTHQYYCIGLSLGLNYLLL